MLSRPPAVFLNFQYPWGNVELRPVPPPGPSSPSSSPSLAYRANYFQGSFPSSNVASDGWEFTAPVGQYGPQNAYGLYNMVGNVWEWVDDWWAGPPGAAGGGGSDEAPKSDKVKRGGSFLCHPDYCFRYRNSARSKNTPDSTASNLGFRCAADVDEN